MFQTVELEKIDAEIHRLKSAAEKIERMAVDFPALSRNSTRILAGIKMLELNLSDLVALDKPEPS